MGRMFGTDGVRGIAGSELDISLAMKIGLAATQTVREATGNKTPKFLIGKDTRRSSDMLEAAVAAGICEAGGNAVVLGVVPTPAVAYLTKELGFDAGVMISASHNPFEYNGIKLFGADGCKLMDSEEEEIEKIIREGKEKGFTGEDIGTVKRDDGAVEYYIKHIMSASEGLSGLKIALDCANGSSSHTAAKLFSGLGAKYDLFNSEPNGININDGVGSTHIGFLKQVMKSGKYDIGFAFDGDADRCIAVDERGEEIDGDAEMAVLAIAMKEQGKLINNGFVATVMSNIGLHRFAEQNGIELGISAVGDRYALEMMKEQGKVLGGERSGHIICLEHMTTGDGQLTAVLFADRMKKTGKKASDLAGVMKKYPQAEKSIKADAEMKERYKKSEDLKSVISEIEKKLGDGRVLVRPSGTEPLIRVMAEGIDMKTVDEVVDECVQEIERQLKKEL